MGAKERDYVEKKGCDTLKKHVELGDEAAKNGNVILEALHHRGVQDTLKSQGKKFYKDPECKKAYSTNSQVLHEFVAVDVGVSSKMSTQLQALIQNSLSQY
jgi:hypothetical protein